MKISIFGSTGATGRELIKQGLEKGYSLSTIIRKPLPVTHPSLTKLEGSIFNKRLVKEAIEGSDLVVSVVAFTPKLLGKKSTDLYSHIATTLVECMTELQVRKLVFCTSAGVVDDPGEIWFYKHILKPLYLKKGYQNMQLAEAIVTRSSLDWILVRPSRLTNGALTTRFRISENLRPNGGTSISRADLAYFILNQATDNTWVHKTPTLAY